jgi:hypothetical protein
LRYFTLAAGLAIVLLVVGVTWVEEGEVITITTVDDDGHTSLTGLWIVEVGARSYLRAASPSAHWLVRIRKHPEIELERKGIVRRFRAKPSDDPTVQIAVDWAMRQKYGLIDAVLVRLIDHSRSVPILVEPVAAADDAAAGLGISAGGSQ